MHDYNRGLIARFIKHTYIGCFVLYNCDSRINWYIYNYCNMALLH